MLTLFNFVLTFSVVFFHSWFNDIFYELFLTISFFLFSNVLQEMLPKVLAVPKFVLWFVFDSIFFALGILVKLLALARSLLVFFRLLLSYVFLCIFFYCSLVSYYLSILLIFDSLFFIYFLMLFSYSASSLLCLRLERGDYISTALETLSFFG